jgi:hypothetical protein
MCRYFHGPEIVTVLFAQVVSGMCVCGVLGAYGAKELHTTTYLPLIYLPLRKGT